METLTTDPITEPPFNQIDVPETDVICAAIMRTNPYDALAYSAMFRHMNNKRAVSSEF